MSIDLTQLRQVFSEESFAGPDAAEAVPLEFGEGADDTGFVHLIFRSAQSIQGASARFSVGSTSDFTLAEVGGRLSGFSPHPALLKTGKGPVHLFRELADLGHKELLV